MITPTVVCRRWSAVVCPRLHLRCPRDPPARHVAVRVVAELPARRRADHRMRPHAPRPARRIPVPHPVLVRQVPDRVVRIRLVPGDGAPAVRPHARVHAPRRQPVQRVVRIRVARTYSRLFGLIHANSS